MPQTIFRIEYKFFWHGYNHCQKEFGTLDAAKSFIKTLRDKSNGFKYKGIRLIRIVTY